MSACETLMHSLTANLRFWGETAFLSSILAPLSSNFLPPCFGCCFSIHAAGSVVHCRCQTEVDGCQSSSSLSPVLSFHLSTPSLHHCLSFCLFLSFAHLYHPSSVVSVKTPSTRFSLSPHHHGSHSHIPNTSQHFRRRLQIMVFFLPKGQISSTEVDYHSVSHGPLRHRQNSNLNLIYLH